MDPSWRRADRAFPLLAPLRWCDHATQLFTPAIHDVISHIGLDRLVPSRPAPLRALATATRDALRPAKYNPPPAPHWRHCTRPKSVEEVPVLYQLTARLLQYLSPRALASRPRNDYVRLVRRSEPKHGHTSNPLGADLPGLAAHAPGPRTPESEYTFAEGGHFGDHDTAGDSGLGDALPMDSDTA